MILIVFLNLLPQSKISVTQILLINNLSTSLILITEEPYLQLWTDLNLAKEKFYLRALRGI